MGAHSDRKGMSGALDWACKVAVYCEIAARVEIPGMSGVWVLKETPRAASCDGPYRGCATLSHIFLIRSLRNQQRHKQRFQRSRVSQKTWGHMVASLPGLSPTGENRSLHSVLQNTCATCAGSPITHTCATSAGSPCAHHA